MTVNLGPWVLMTCRFTPTQRKPYAFRLYLNRNQIEVGVGDRGWTAVVLRRSRDTQAMKKAQRTA